MDTTKNKCPHCNGSLIHIEKICPVCQSPFISKRRNKKYCGAACRQKYYRMFKIVTY